MCVFIVMCFVLCRAVPCCCHHTTVAALQAADKLLLAREVVAGVVSRHGLAVSCLPKVMANQAGNGCHVHFSLWRVSQLFERC